MGAPTEFTVDCSKSGPGDVTVNITSAKRKTVPVSINDNGDDTYTVTYEAQVVGPQTIVINLDDNEVPQSPIKLDVKPAADLSKVSLIGNLKKKIPNITWSKNRKFCLRSSIHSFHFHESFRKKNHEKFVIFS